MTEFTSFQEPTAAVYNAIIALEVIYGVFFFVGILENVVVFRETIRKKGRRKLTTNQLLVLHLALADILVLLTLTPAIFYGDASGDISLTSFLACRLIVPMVMFYHYLRVFSQVAIAIERRRAIVTPLKPRFSKTAIIWALVICWLLSAAFTVPLVVDARFGPIQCEVTQETHFHRAGYNIVRFLAQFIIPLTIIAACYINVIAALRKSRFPSTSLGENKSIQHEVNRQCNLRACKAFAIMGLVFAMWTTPFNAICLWMEHGSGQDAPFVNRALYCFIANFPVLFVSFIDPFIYGACCQRRLQRCKQKMSAVVTRMSTMFTRH